MNKIIKKTIKLRTDSRGGVFLRIPIVFSRIMNINPGSKAEIAIDVLEEGKFSVSILEDKK